MISKKDLKDPSCARKTTVSENKIEWTRGLPHTLPSKWDLADNLPDSINQIYLQNLIDEAIALPSSQGLDQNFDPVSLEKGIQYPFSLTSTNLMVTHTDKEGNKNTQVLGSLLEVIAFA